ncbi:MAG: hypothetical protein K5930_05060 [Treponemataceae bacterium]|nr:hypothetical protein [Treponemataceae bacterium]
MTLKVSDIVESLIPPHISGQTSVKNSIQAREVIFNDLEEIKKPAGRRLPCEEGFNLEGLRCG